MTPFTLLAGLSALLLDAAFPRYSFWPAAFVAMVPLLQAVEGARDPRAAFRAGFLWGLFFFSLLLWWLVPTVSTYGRIHFLLAVPVVMCLCCYLAVYPGLWACVSRMIYGRGTLGLVPALGVSSCWVVAEAARSVFLTGFPWGLIGYSLTPVPILVQSADLWSVYGVGFVVIFFNASVFEACRIARRAREDEGRFLRSFLPMAAAFVLVLAFYFAYGLSKTARASTKASIWASAVQAAMDQSIKWAPEVTRFTVETYVELTRKAAEGHPEMKLTVWPETAMPFYFQEESETRRQVLELARSQGLFILLGSPSYSYGSDGRPRYLNSAYLIGPEGTILGRYDKNHLVPFGEYMPFGRLTAWARRFLPTAGDFEAGKDLKPLTGGRFRIGTMICFESIFPDIARKEVMGGANLLAVITNDAWFGRTAAPYQHADMAVFRAVENRRWLIRAANTGISRIISPSGHVTAGSELFKRQFILGQVALDQEETFYSRYGASWFIALNLAVVVAAVYGANAKRRRVVSKTG